jgi:prevent-host-death family protein
VEVAISDLRARLSEWLERAKDGDEIVVTDRGVPVARLLGVAHSDSLQQLTSDGVIGRAPSAARPWAKNRRRATVRSSVSDLIGDARR